jgi:hypothetical protein
MCMRLHARGVTLSFERSVDVGVTFFIDRKVWHLDVGSSPPGVVGGSKGWVVLPLMWYVCWVQNVVRQFGLYPVWALEHWEDLSLVREDREGHTFGKRWVAKSEQDNYWKHISSKTTPRWVSWDFDPGSGWMLTACLTHASRTGSGVYSGERVSNA